MSLKVGGLDVVGVFVGDAAAKIYVGAMRIWPPVPDFTPFSISSEDPGYTDIYDEPVPEGASGCWVTLVGWRRRRRLHHIRRVTDERREGR
ncbi:hypothetical protein SEA_ANGLERFISH_36 [Mycobacterium phage Anglerfish]|nr:hypothetical protein SEA_ANGLERFISH_36 [Mycobacterium phage Anglerfish]